MSSALCDTVAKSGARVAGQPAGHVDGNDRYPGLVRSLDNAMRCAFQGPTQAGAEQRIDQQLAGAFKQVPGQRQNLPLPKGGVSGSIPLQSCDVAEQGQAHRPSGLTQQAGDHKSVAAVIARSAADERWARSPARFNRLGDPAPGSRHERFARNARSDSRRVGPIHLRYGQEHLVVF